MEYGYIIIHHHMLIIYKRWYLVYPRNLPINYMAPIFFCNVSLKICVVTWLNMPCTCFFYFKHFVYWKVKLNNNIFVFDLSIFAIRAEIELIGSSEYHVIVIKPIILGQFHKAAVYVSWFFQIYTYKILLICSTL